jgi:hypothetical protein
MSEAETTELNRQRSTGLRRRLELFYVNYAIVVYFLIFEAILAITAVVLGVVGTGSSRVGLTTNVDLVTAWSGVFGALTIMFGITLGLGVTFWVLWDYIDTLR